ncbi:Stk1 family PASTA domain-containing Ser/Thr kinase [Romboutsia sp. CE17]|uniref:Stk1 family PASTA domain-containing Ser/Thr kinase n=1 Tax=Romboutsia sp. CE17 TaxID=2724150 RepID=UPI001442C7C5|nr:Stk1 family PASTA domain-containing Ser/Thr kinase [Romboutsia sp. CE17]QJA09220.1 Stk1 family PASTA domain-containing Ser/Thr kinase [Romboutsia sp. CE17]
MGDTILGNRYQIIRKIGDGGMAFVYEAKDKLLNRTVAVKVLRPEFVDDEEFLNKFKREAEAVASLSHPNIVNVYDVGEDGKVHYIVMEYIDGQNLKDIIKNEGTLDEYTALDITKQIAMALSAAHKKGIVHRDIKPHNILISNEGRIVKVADFGIAKAVTNSTMTNIGSIIGSVHYFSPEQAKGNHVNATADLYSLGIVLYEMIIGRVPFRGDSPISIALQHINEDVEFTSEEKVSIPQSVRTIIKKLTEKSSENRYQSAEELIEDIDYVEKNIDLDFIKEYDNYATKHIEMDRVEESVDFEDEDEYDELLEEEPQIIQPPKNKEKNKKRKNKVVKEDSPKVKKRLKIAAVILGLILIAQVFFIYKFVSGMIGGSSQEEQLITIPDFTNKDLESVNKELKDLGLKVIVRDEYSDTVEKDYVISQSPVAGTQVAEGDTVSIVLSKGQKQGEVPRLVGLTLSDAENILTQNNLNLGNIKYEYSDTYKEGIVLSQSPNSGTTNISKGDDVDVVVSKGPKESESDDDNDDLDDTLNPPTTGNSNNNNNGTTNRPSTGGGSSNGITNRPSTGGGSGSTGGGSGSTSGGSGSTGGGSGSTSGGSGSTDGGSGSTDDGSGSTDGNGDSSGGTTEGGGSDSGTNDGETESPVTE